MRIFLPLFLNTRENLIKAVLPRVQVGVQWERDCRVPALWLLADASFYVSTSREAQPSESVAIRRGWKWFLSILVSGTTLRAGKTLKRLKRTIPKGWSNRSIVYVVLLAPLPPINPWPKHQHRIVFALS